MQLIILDQASTWGVLGGCGSTPSWFGCPETFISFGTFKKASGPFRTLWFLATRYRGGSFPSSISMAPKVIVPLQGPSIGVWQQFSLVEGYSVYFLKKYLLCISTSKRMLTFAFTWSKTTKNIGKWWKKYLFNHAHERLM